MDHCFIFSRSLVSELAVLIVSSSTITYKEVSSANSLTLFDRSSDMSFIYSKNKNGPKTDP